MKIFSVLTPDGSLLIPLAIAIIGIVPFLKIIPALSVIYTEEISPETTWQSWCLINHL
ncbi:MAG TPA: hypothetical protein VM802_06995 [Chitinophaga sp.]|uniref:hypothetical protein n=1 Tax=Chitinophaga sp. TaxID=1869181 RepID=UPI002C678B2B|nr:hypothetical protein [Chitinophaga sp.]HVI44596.1 hypothetical protein [Chitinophaga sp.]